MARSGYGNAGNVNMRGRRKVHVFGCGCCWCADDREQKLTAIDLREAEDALADYEANGGITLARLKKELKLGM